MRVNRTAVGDVSRVIATLVTCIILALASGAMSRAIAASTFRYDPYQPNPPDADCNNGYAWNGVTYPDPTGQAQIVRQTVVIHCTPEPGLGSSSARTSRDWVLDGNYSSDGLTAYQVPMVGGGWDYRQANALVVSNGSNVAECCVVQGGLFLVEDITTNSIGLYIGDAYSGLILVAGNGEWSSPTLSPPSGHSSLGFDANHTMHIYNNTGNQQSYRMINAMLR